MRETIANGVRGTSMPAFAQRAGGMLTEKQIDALVSGIRSRWSRPGVLDGANPPSYTPRRRRATFGAAKRRTRPSAESCHGPDGRGGPKGSAITNDSFLALVERSGAAHDRDRRPSRAGRSRLARKRRRAADVGTGSHRRGELARLAPRRSAGTAVRRSTRRQRQEHARVERNSADPPRPVHEAGDPVQRRRGRGAGRPDRALSCRRRSRWAGRTATLAWVPLGRVSEFPEGETRLATFRNPFVTPTDGKTADTACWVRRIEGEQFQVFAVNCAHLGCPVRWFPQSGLFMCPCHGGAYYRDGSRASGPPERGLFEYPIKVENGVAHDSRRRAADAGPNARASEGEGRRHAPDRRDCGVVRPPPAAGGAHSRSRRTSRAAQHGELVVRLRQRRARRASASSSRPASSSRWSTCRRPTRRGAACRR